MVAWLCYPFGEKRVEEGGWWELTGSWARLMGYDGSDEVCDAAGGFLWRSGWRRSSHSGHSGPDGYSWRANTLSFVGAINVWCCKTSMSNPGLEGVHGYLFSAHSQFPPHSAPRHSPCSGYANITHGAFSLDKPTPCIVSAETSSTHPTMRSTTLRLSTRGARSLRPQSFLRAPLLATQTFRPQPAIQTPHVRPVSHLGSHRVAKDPVERERRRTYEAAKLSDGEYHELSDYYLDLICTKFEDLQDARDDVDVEFAVWHFFLPSSCAFIFPILPLLKPPLPKPLLFLASISMPSLPP